MKKFIIAVLATCITVLTAHSQTEERLVIHAGQVTTLDIADNMNVVLVQSSAADSVTRINSETSKKLQITLSPDALSVSPAHGLSRNAVVYIVVGDLKTLTLGQATKLQNEGTLQLNKLDIYLQDNCVVKIRTNGKVKAYSLGQFEVNLTRTPVMTGVVATTF